MWSTLVEAIRNSLLDINTLYFLMGIVAVGGLGIATTLMIRGGVVEGDGRFARHVRRMQTALPAVVVLCVTLIAAGIQGGLERTVHNALAWDFTHHVYALEGDAVGRFQQAVRHPWLDVVLVSVYTAGAFLLYFIPFFTLVAMGRGRSALRLALTIAGIWAVGIVTYFLVPVYEVWYVTSQPYYTGTPVTPILFEYFPEYEGSATYLNSVNNNIPSLHTAVNAGIATSLWLARERWLAVLVTPVAAGIVTATFYLGIHWFTDVVTGLLVMAASAWLAHRLVPREETEFSPLAWLRRRRRADDAAAAPPEA